MSLVFDIVETINIGFEAVAGEAASPLRSQLSDVTIRRSLRKRFMEIVDTEFAELPGGPAALRKVVSSRNFVRLVCGDNLTDQTVSVVENEFIDATDSMDGAELSLLRNCLSKAALRVIEKSLPIGHRAILRGIQAISAKEGGYLDPAERMLLGSAAAPARMPDPLPAALAGRLIAPPLPDAFCARPAVHDRILGLLGQSGGGQAPIVAMAGMGGSGKTLLAQAVAHDPEIEARFPDGVLWLEVGDTPDLLCQAAILGAVGAVPAGDSVEAGRTALRQRLLGARCLLILDDVVRAGQVRALDVAGPGSALLVTTRYRDQLPHGTLTCPVRAFDLADPVEHADAMSLLAQYASGTPDIASADAAHAEEVVTRCGGLPLALAICGAMVSDGYPWETVVDLLRKADLASLEKAFRGYPRPSLLSAIAVGATSLEAPTLALYEELAVFSTRGGVPVKAAARLWSHHGLDADDSLRTVIFLGRRSLLTYRPADSAFLLHDLQYDYTRWRVGAGLADLHCRLADSYLTSWGGVSAGLPALDPADARIDDCRYGITYVADHLAKADRDDLLHALLAAELPASSGGSGNSWFDVHDQLGWTAEYFADIDSARVRAEKSTDQAATPADRARHIATEIRYALVRSSLASIAGTISPRLLAVLVRRGMWSFEKARAYAIVIPDAEDRAAVLTVLARLPESGTSDRAHLLGLAKQAAGSITYSMQRAMAYGRIAVASSEPDRSLLFDQALEAADASSQAGRVRAWLLTWLAPHYPARAVAELRRGAAAGPSAVEYRHAMTAALEMLPDLRDDVLHTARHGHYRGERSAAFRAVLLCTPPEQRPAIIEEMLTAIASSDKQWRKEELAAEAAAYLPAEHLPAFLAETLDGASPHATIRALARALPRFPADQRADAQAAAVSAVRAAGPGANRQDLLALLPCIPEPDRTNLIEEIVDAAQHAYPARAVWLLCDLAPILPEHLLRRAVDTSDEVSPPSRAVGLLAPYLTPELLRRALAAHSLDSAEEWAGAFVHLAPYLPRTSLRQIVELVAVVKDESRRLALLTRLTPCLPPDLVGLAAETAESASDIETRAQILAELASRAQEPQRSALYRQALDAAESENYPHTRFRALAQMTAKPEHLADVLRMQCTLDERRGRHTRADLRSMALPDPVINLAVEIVHGIEEPCSRARALAILVPHVTESRRPGLLKEAAEDGFRPHDHPDDIGCEALQALEKAAVAVPAAARLPLAWHLTQTLITDQNPGRMRQLIWLAVYLSDKYGDDLQGQALQCAAKLSAADEPPWVRRHGVSGFRKLAPYLSPERLLQATALVQALDEPDQQSAALAALAAHADPATRPPIMTSTVARARSITSAYELREVLAELAPYLPDNDTAALLSRLIDLTRGQQPGGSNYLASAIAEVAPALHAELAAQMANAARNQPVASERAQSSRALALARSGASLKQWSPYWRTAIIDAAAAGRPALLTRVAELPLKPSEDSPADMADATAWHIAQALKDTRRWWPSDP